MKKRKGFTLIELLAVIVIIGLLMAIAIPSITKYLTSSKKKTTETSIHEFATALTVEVNDSEYALEKDNTIYAIPIECIELEKGGDNPFGKWMPANNEQWAYTLVQYDEVKRNYVYGFTFKDTEGYGLYPTEISKLDGSGSQIKKDLDLSKPMNGSYKLITAKDNWDGFKLDNDTEVFVFGATKSGNGKSTCTIKHDVDESEVPDVSEEDIIENGGSNNETKESKAYAIYSSDNYSLTFVRLDEDVEVKVGDVFLGNVVTEIFTGFENTKLVPWSKYADKITNVVFNDEIYPLSTASWFEGFVKLNGISNINNLHTENTTDMKYMFFDAGKDSLNFTLDLGNNFDTSNVTNMSAMFYNTGYASKSFKLNLGNKFNTSKVTDMYTMFYHTGYSSTVMTLDLGDKFDTSNVTSMRLMFCSTGYSSPVFTLNLGDNFNTSKVTNMMQMFYETGYLSKVFKLDLGTKFNTSNVTDMDSMFYYSGYSSPVFTLNLGNNFDTSKVVDMYSMFIKAGYSSTVFTLDLGDKFDTSNVTNMGQTFHSVGYSNPNFTFDLGDKFDTSKVTSMDGMFVNMGYSSNVFTLDLGDKFDTSNVTGMRLMFHAIGYSSPVFTLDLGDKFDTSKVDDMLQMFIMAGYNSEKFTLDLGDKYDTSKVTTMNGMFMAAGHSSPIFTLDLGDKFDTGNVVDMSFMFASTGYNSSSFKIDCSKWDVSKVIDYEDFNGGAESKVTPPAWK